MAGRKSKHALEVPFSLEVSNAMRHHSGTAKSLASKRDNAFEDRDAALAELADIEDQHSEDALKLKERHSDAVVKIDELSDLIKWHTKQVLDMALKADDPGVEILYEKPDEPPPPESKTKKSTEDKTQLKIQPEAPVAEGEDQQLAVDISNLDLSGPLQAKLRKANVNTIAQLVAIADDRGRNLRDELNLGNGPCVALEAALEAYRKKHRRAIAEADQEGAAPKR